MNASWSLVQFLRDPGMREAVQAEIDTAHEDDTYSVRPDVGDVIAEGLAAVINDARERAMDLSDCDKVDDCRAKAAFLTRLADWLESQP